MNKVTDRPCTPEEVKLWQQVMTRNQMTFPLPMARMSRIHNERCHFKTSLDLHGMTVADAHQTALSYVADAFRLALPEVTVITGRSGTIRAEFATWMALSPHVRSIQEKNGGGAFSVLLK
jgi:DNA-nicking Smr family endonuclease